MILICFQHNILQIYQEHETIMFVVVEAPTIHEVLGRGGWYELMSRLLVDLKDMETCKRTFEGAIQPHSL